LHKYHASFCIHSFKFGSHTLFLKGSILLKKWPDVLIQSQLAPTTLVQTRKGKMDQIEQKIHELREEVTTLRAELKKLSTLVALLAVAQNSPQFQQKPQQQYQQRYQQQPRQQAPQQLTPHNSVQRAPRYDLIPMKYEELLPVLLEKNIVQTRAPPRVLENMSVRYTLDLSCAFHQGAPCHDIQHYFSLRIKVQKLIEANIFSFKDLNPNVQVKPLPNHGTSYADMVQDNPEEVISRSG